MDLHWNHWLDLYFTYIFSQLTIFNQHVCIKLTNCWKKNSQQTVLFMLSFIQKFKTVGLTTLETEIVFQHVPTVCIKQTTNCLETNFAALNSEVRAALGLRTPPRWRRLPAAAEMRHGRGPELGTVQTAGKFKRFWKKKTEDETIRFWMFFVNSCNF